MLQPTPETTALLRSHLLLLRTVVPVFIGRGRYMRANGTRTVVHLATDANDDGQLLCGGRVSDIQGQVAAATQEPHHSNQCPRCWMELTRSARERQARTPSAR